MDHLRTLLYPLGFLSSIAFAARFILQWIQSEIKGYCSVSRIFWQLSLVGNIFLAVHGFIQSQYPICLFQVFNGMISWRNLNLMSLKPYPFSLKRSLSAAGVAFMFITLAFFFLYKESWMRAPATPWQTTLPESPTWAWHIAGLFGYSLFSSRFFVQWWISETKGKSCLPPGFWWMSLGGAVLSILYFIKTSDVVNLVGPLFGLPSYLRNLFLSQSAAPDLHTEVSEKT